MEWRRWLQGWVTINKLHLWFVLRVLSKTDGPMASGLLDTPVQIPRFAEESPNRAGSPVYTVLLFVARRP